MYYVYYHNYPCRTPQLHFLRFNQKHEGGGDKRHVILPMSKTWWNTYPQTPYDLRHWR